jgi:SAM-dependent methyltransferase
VEISPASPHLIATPPCPLCEGQRGAPWISSRDLLAGGPGSFTFVQCSRCGLLRLHPRPADLRPNYPDDYEFFVAYERKLGLLPALARWYGHRKRGDIVAQASGRRSGSLLDVGCATGAFLAAMRRRGWCVQGVEPNPSAATIARCRGLQIHHATLETAGLAPGQFDVLTMWDVLEHVPEPLATLRAAAQVLKPGATAIIRIPSPLGLDAGLFGRYWTGLDIPRHFWLLTWAKLKAMLLRVGFAHVERRYDYGPYHMWRYSAEHWIGARAPASLAVAMKSALRSPLAQVATWPFFRAIQRSELNSLLLAVAYR